MKNIILVILAILFIIIILFHFMNVQLEHFDCSQIDTNDKISKIFNKLKISPNEFDIISSTLALKGIHSDDSIVTALLNLGLSKSELTNILEDHVSYPTSTEKINVFKCGFKNMIKSELEEDLVIYYPLDTIHSDGKTIINESLYAQFATNKYNGTIAGNKLPWLDSSDVRGNGIQSMRFDGNGSNTGGYIQIDKLPSFWDQSGTKFTGFSLAVWVKASEYEHNRNWSRIFDFALGQAGQQAGFNNNIFITVTNTHNPRRGDLMFLSANGTWEKQDGVTGVTYQAPDGNGVVDNTWRHFVFTITPSNPEGKVNYKVYVNGILANSNYENNVQIPRNTSQGTSVFSNISADPTKTKHPNNVIRTCNYIGRSNFSWDGYFNGWMTDFRIYTKELTPEVIKKLYHSVNPTITVQSTSVADLNKYLASQTEAIPKYPGGPLPTPPKINVLLIGMPDYITTNTDKSITWQDNSTLKNNGVANSNKVQYCPITYKVTVPSGSYMEIGLNSSNYVAPLTIFAVADVKTFNPTEAKGSGGFACNFLFGAPGHGGLAIGFTGNHVVCFVQNTQAIIVPLTMSGLQGNGKNIYTIQYDSTGNVNIWINGFNVVNKTMPLNVINVNQPIRLGCAYEPNQYPSTSNIDYYHFIHISGLINMDAIQMTEALLANVSNIKDKLNPENKYYTSQFNIK